MAKTKGVRQALEGDISGLSFKTTKTKPTSSFPVTSYRIPSDLAEAIKQIADDLSVSPADVARVFLSESLQAYKAGRLVLKPKPEKYSLD